MARSEKTFDVQGSVDEVFKAALQVLGSMGVNIETADPQARHIAGKIGANLLTWGEMMRVEIHPEAAGCRVVVSSETSQTIAWGKNTMNLSTFEDRLLQTLRAVPPMAAPGMPGMESPAQPVVTAPQKGHRIFISYRRADSADICGRIYDRLVAEFSRDTVFKDVDSIPLGVDFKEFLDQSIRECSAVLVIIGPQWVSIQDSGGRHRLDNPDDFVRIEVESALERDIPVVPLLVYGAAMPAAEHLPESLRPLALRNGIAIRPDPDFHNDMNRLIHNLTAVG